MRDVGKSLRFAAAFAAIAFLAGTSPGAAKMVSIVNGTRTAMVELQVRPVDAPIWRPDLLDRKTLGIQKEISIDVGPACEFDVKARFEDGHRVMKERVNFCKSSTYLLTDF